MKKLQTSASHIRDAFEKRENSKAEHGSLPQKKLRKATTKEFLARVGGQEKDTKD